MINPNDIDKTSTNAMSGNFAMRLNHDDDKNKANYNSFKYLNTTKFSKVFYKRKTNTNQSALTIQTIMFILIGVLIGFCLATSLRQTLLNCSSSQSCCFNSGDDTSNFVDDNGVKIDQVGQDGLDSQKNGENDIGNRRIKIYKNIEPNKNLVFIGVMTAQKYLDTRANSVFKTWGKSIPGKMSFFSRSGSSSTFNLPLVSLPGVDDSYPPQKKSFMMLKFMHDNYLDKFEWFMRVDDDVYIKPEKLEYFLRSLNSSVPQFIGQAGLGNKDEFGLLSLDYDENFCMGGPGIVMSRETLKLVVPHISYCLKNLYSTHEDVEIGRCVRKFANISCTWSYEMQHIFHHNSSGNDAFTGELLSREVLRATSLHPIKKSPYQYRLHNFMNMRKIIDLRQRYLTLKRETFELKRELLKLDTSNAFDSTSNATNSYKSSTTSILSTSSLDFEVDSDFDNFILNKNENLDKNLLSNRFNLQPSLKDLKMPKRRRHRHDFEFFTRSLFSPTYISPKRGLEGYWKKALSETVRQIMDEINRNSIERGRLIDYKDTLYGYMRHHPLIGIDYIIDILLVYRKYEGRKMTVPVRRHAYVRNTYTTMLFREDNLVDSEYLKVEDKYRPFNPNHTSNNFDPISNTNPEQNDKNILQKFLDAMFVFNKENPSKQEFNKANLNNLNNDMIYSNLERTKLADENEHFFIERKLAQKTINFVLPLTGRWLIFKRFMLNFERVVFEMEESNIRLVIVLFEAPADEQIVDYDLTSSKDVKFKQSELIKLLFARLKQKYSNKISDKTLQLRLVQGNFSRSIGCELGAAMFDQNELIFFIDVDILFTNDFLLRTRLNTIQYKQVYYPIVYSEYDPDNIIDAIKFLTNKTNEASAKAFGNERKHFVFSLDDGYWRQFGFGIVAVYNSDLRSVGGFDTSIIGWGKEDVDLYEKFVKSNLTIFRSVDPGLVHVFHKIECDSNLAEEQLVMCMGSKSTSIASQANLAKLIYEKKSYLIEPKLDMSTSQTSSSTTKKKVVNNNNAPIGKLFPGKNG